MAKRFSHYKSEKRKNELKRKKKQEEKRLKRLKGTNPSEENPEEQATDPEVFAEVTATEGETKTEQGED